MSAMIFHPHSQLETACHAIAARLERLARLCCRGTITEQTFIDLVLKIEAEEIRPSGLTLVASNTRDEWTVFNVKINGANEPCAGFEFLPETGEFRHSVEANACAG